MFEEARNARDGLNTPEADREAVQADPAYRLDPLGSGSDFTPFLQHLTSRRSTSGSAARVLAASITRSTTSVNWYQVLRFRFQLRPHAVAATGTLALRLADAPVLPFQFSDTGRHARALRRSSSKSWRPSKKDAKVDLKPVRAAVEALKRAGELRAGIRRARRAYSEATFVGRAELRQLNQQLLGAERRLGNSDGLPRRDVV